MTLWGLRRSGTLLHILPATPILWPAGCPASCRAAHKAPAGRELAVLSDDFLQSGSRPQCSASRPQDLYPVAQQGEGLVGPVDKVVVDLPQIAAARTYTVLYVYTLYNNIYIYIYISIISRTSIIFIISIISTTIIITIIIIITSVTITIIVKYQILCP